MRCIALFIGRSFRGLRHTVWLKQSHHPQLVGAAEHPQLNDLRQEFYKTLQ
jgi:hypothetical protein